MARNQYTIPLLKNLAPFALFISATSALLPWDRPLPSHKVLLFLRYAVTAFTGLGMCCVLALGVYSTFGMMTSPKYDVYDIIATWLQYGSFPISITTSACFAWNRNSIQEFLQSWARLEAPLDTRKDLHIKPLAYYRSFSLFLVIIVTCMWLYLALSDVGTHHVKATLFNLGIVSNTHSVILIQALASFIYFYVILLNYFGEVFLCYVYRHLANLLGKIEQAFLVDMATLGKLPATEMSRLTNSVSVSFVPPSKKTRSGLVRCLDEDLTSISTMGTIKQLWSRYKHVQSLVDRANTLLGRLLFVDYFIGFMTIVGGLFVLLTVLRSQTKVQTEMTTGIEFILIAGTFTTVFIVKVTLATIVCGSLPQQWQKFENTVSSLLQDQWEKFFSEEQQLLQALLQHIRQNPLAANSLGLFSIRTSTLLSMLSLIVTYVIVLVQTQAQ